MQESPIIYNWSEALKNVTNDFWNNTNSNNKDYCLCYKYEMK